MNIQSVRVLFLGDQGVGKTSLINAIIGQTFKQRKQKILPPVILPPQLNQPFIQATTILIDSQGTTGQIQGITHKRQINQASVIVLVYDIWRQQTIDGLSNYWLPLIKKSNQHVPVIIVANKKDQDSNVDNQSRVQNVIRQLIRKFSQVQMGIQCSSMKGQHVSSVLVCAQKAALFPIGVLYDLNSMQITQAFQKALIRIFRIIDVNMDGLLSDNQLIAFQQQVFKGNLTKQHIDSIKQLIRQQLQLDQVNQIDIRGFIALQKKCIQMLKIQTCWTILHYYGYDNYLKLHCQFPSDDFGNFKNEGSNLQFSKEGIKLLRKQFKRYCKNGKMTMDILNQVFYPTPKNIFTPLLDSITLYYYNQRPYITQDQWLLLWQLALFNNQSQCYFYMNFIGIKANILQIFKKTNHKLSLSSIKQTKYRQVLSICFIGKRKKQLIQQLIQKYGKKSIKKQQIQNFGQKNFIFKFLYQDQVQIFMQTQYKSYDLFVLCYDSIQQINLQIITKQQVCKVGLIKNPLQIQYYFGLHIKNYKKQKFIQNLWQMFLKPQVCLNKQYLIALQSKQSGTGLLQKGFFIGMAILALTILLKRFKTK